MMKTMILCFCLSSNNIKNRIVLVKSNVGHDEAKLMQLIVSGGCFFPRLLEQKKGMRAGQR